MFQELCTDHQPLPAVTAPQVPVYVKLEEVNEQLSSTLNMTQRIRYSAHVFPDELRDSAGQHEAGDSAAHDVEEGVHDPCAGGGFDWRTEGTAERAGSWSTAAADLRRR